MGPSKQQKWRGRQKAGGGLRRLFPYSSHPEDNPNLVILTYYVTHNEHSGAKQSFLSFVNQKSLFID